jgi:uncharacterized protein
MEGQGRERRTARGRWLLVLAVVLGTSLALWVRYGTQLRELLEGDPQQSPGSASAEGSDAEPEKASGCERSGDGLRVLLAGASSIQFYLGDQVERRLEAYPQVKVDRFGKLGTGLARPDVFDWDRALGGLVSRLRPQVVIGQFGGNDGQALRLPSRQTAPFGTPAWEEEYGRRVRAVVQTVQSRGACMVMLGMHVTRHQKLSERFVRINTLTREATEEAGGIYVDTWQLAADAGGAARAKVTFEGSGPMYLGDGIHYSRRGAAFVASQLVPRLEGVLRLNPLAGVSPSAQSTPNR